MIQRKEFHNALSVLLSLALIIGSAKIFAGFQNPADTAAPTEAAALTQGELRALVAPIALYPDKLVALVLAAATFPDQVAIADYWLEQNKKLTGSALMQDVNKQPWDASVKGLTEFPSVLKDMAKNLSWTSQLGEAYHNQKSEVMKAVQALRAEARAKGTLQSTPQMTVVQQTPQTIVIEPANPNVVYVPEYDPAVIYGYPYVTPGYTSGAVAADSAISFGAGVVVGALAAGGWGWGWHAWGCDWAAGAVAYNHAAYFGNAAWHGAYHPYGFDGAYHPYGEAYNRANFNRNVTRNTVNVNRGIQNFGGNHFSDANSWAHHDNWAGHSTAFSGLNSHFGGFGGWSSRADSARGWGSMRAGGFSGFHGGFGGGFHGRR